MERALPKYLSNGTYAVVGPSERCYTQTASESRQKEKVCFGHF